MIAPRIVRGRDVVYAYHGRTPDAVERDLMARGLWSFGRLPSDAEAGLVFTGKEWVRLDPLDLAALGLPSGSAGHLGELLRAKGLGLLEDDV